MPHHNRKPIYCTTTDRVFESYKEAADYYGFPCTAFWGYFRGLRKHVGRSHEGIPLKWEEIKSGEGFIRIITQLQNRETIIEDRIRDIENSVADLLTKQRKLENMLKQKLDSGQIDTLFHRLDEITELRNRLYNLIATVDTIEKNQGNHKLRWYAKLFNLFKG